MNEVDLGDGVSITLPENVAVRETSRELAAAATAGATRIHRAPRSNTSRPQGPIPFAGGVGDASEAPSSDPIDPVFNSTDLLGNLRDALAAGDEMTLVKEVVIGGNGDAVRRGAGAGGGRPIKRGPIPVNPAPEAAPTVAVNVGFGDSAALLIEQDGVFQWVLPDEENQLLPPGTVRRGGEAEEPTRQLIFRLDVVEKNDDRPQSPDATRSRRLRGSIVADVVLKPVKALLFKFAARVLAGALMPYLEKNKRDGWVWMKGNDPAQWQLLDSSAPVRALLPTDRPARILLFIHGTFSTTLGSFGGLGATPWGKAFLDGAGERYDALLAWDHLTLSVDPMKNATDLLAALKQVFPTGSPIPEIDVVTYSRGGMIFRALAELLLPVDGFPVKFGSVTFVAVTNGGTHLAEPENWKVLADTYTNLAVYGCRALALFPQATVAAAALQEIVSGLGALVKALATVAVTENEVPGLAAMQPSPKGAFVTNLNAIQPGQPAADQVRYYAITSSFGRDNFIEADEYSLPQNVAQAIISRFTTDLYKTDNDLVVDTASMKAIDLVVGGTPFIRDSFDFGPTRRVYHTTYFVRPEVSRALARFLGIPDTGDAVAVAAANMRRGLRGPIAAPIGQRVGTPLPIRAHSDILTLKASLTKAEAEELLNASEAGHIVVDRSYGDERLYYAFRVEEFREKLNELRNNRDTLEEFLSESHTSQMLDGAREAASFTAKRGSDFSDGRGVVLQNGRPAAVITEEDFPSIEELARLAREIDGNDEGFEAITPPEDGGGFEDTRPDDGHGSRVPTSFTHSTRRQSIRRITTFSASPITIPMEEAPEPHPPLTGATPEAMPPAPMTLNYLAEMKDTLVVGEVTPLLVTLSPEKIAGILQSTATGGGSIAAVQTDRDLTVVVMATRNLEIIGDSSQMVSPSTVGKGKTLTFALRGTNEGKAEARILILQNGVALATLVLESAVIVAAQKNAVRTATVSTVIAANTPPLFASSPPLQMIVMELDNGAERRFQYFLVDNGTVGSTGRFLSEPLQAERGAFVDNIYRLIEERWDNTKKGAGDFAAELQAIGADLFKQLFPKPLQEILWNRRDTLDSIFVVSYEPFIPWEIVHLCDPNAPGGLDTENPQFLGLKGLVRWLNDVPYAATFHVRPDKARYVIPDYPGKTDAQIQSGLPGELPGTSGERAYLESVWGAKPIAPHPSDVRKALSTPDTFDLLHFACHGEAQTVDIQNALLVMEGRVENGAYYGETLGLNTIAQFSNLRGPSNNRPIVVVNACQTGRLGTGLTRIGGFADAFINAGAGAFVGALWSVDDTAADTFIRVWYERLRAGDTLSAATTAARLASKAANADTYLAYTVYGHPLATLKR